VGKPEEAIQGALALTLQMNFIELDDQEVKAVAAYLQYLETQP
jgi:cytochrome c